MTPPKFVKESTDPTFVWIAASDALYHLDGTICDDDSGLKFWTANCKIRNAFYKLRSEIEFGENIKVNISNLAVLAKVERVSIYNQKRKWWIDDQIKELLLLKGRLSREKIHKEIKEHGEIASLNQKLKFSRGQVAQLTFDKTELNRTIETCQRKIRMQEKQIELLKGLADR